MLVAGDFETYYDRDYSLSKMSETDYILDDRFETIMLGLKLGSAPTRTYVGAPAIAGALARLDWDNVAWVSHHTRFDGAILAWRFGCIPKLYLDTLSMARAATHWNLGRSSLKAVSDYLSLPPKGDEVVRAQGKRLADFTAQELAAYRAYCVRDNDNCYEIFQRMRPHFPATEIQIIDLILRMGILPQVMLDSEVLATHLDEVRAEKARIMETAEIAQIDKSEFASNQKFAALLEKAGVEVPTKISPTTNKEIPAIAKNDRAFKELCVDDSQPLYVQMLLAARLATKSTIEETRTGALLRQAHLSWPVQGTGWATVPLKYSGARTHRLSGDDGMNWQNFRRGSRIREAVVAPPGYRIVHRDASQIEARMVAWMASCKILIEAFAENRDVYSEFATIVFGRKVTRLDVAERFVGKTAILGLGYGCGADRFRHMLFIGSGGVNYRASDQEAQRIVHQYRGWYPEIPALWNAMKYLVGEVVECGEHGSWMLRKEMQPTIARLPIAAGYDSIVLPNGLRIVYPRLRKVEDFDYFYDDLYGGRAKLYGAKATENVSQALSRIVVTDVMLRIHILTGHRPFLTTHDSLDYCVPEAEAGELDAELEYQFSVRPTWARTLPLASEGGWGETLRDAERGVNQ